MKFWHKLGIVIFTGGVLGIAVFSGTITHSGPADIYPSKDTPGSINTDITQGTLSKTLCNSSWSTKSIRPSTSYTDKLKVADMATYALKGTKADYELDHLISIELGGNPIDPKNLWMEPYDASIPDGGAKNKDSVENYLHKQLCNGTITLQEAQKEISTDWYKVYKQMHSQFGAIESDIDTDDN